MNTLLNANCCDLGIVGIICATVLVFVVIVCGTIIKWQRTKINAEKELSIVDKDNGTQNNNNANQVSQEENKLELQRQDRVRALLKEIVSLSSYKDVNVNAKGEEVYYEKFNYDEAKKLFELYKAIDTHMNSLSTKKENENRG